MSGSEDPLARDLANAVGELIEHRHIIDTDYLAERWKAVGQALDAWEAANP